MTMSWIEIHRIEPLSDGKTAMVILKCVGCSEPEHRINYNLPIPQWGEDRGAIAYRSTAAWLENVRIMAAAGCKGARTELEQRR